VADERETGDKLTRAQLELVLRRAAELEQNRGSESAELISPSELEKIAAEAGLSQDSLSRALAEVRSGALQPIAPVAPPGVLDRAIGPERLVVERVVRGPVEDVKRRLERFLKDQLLQVKRNFGDRVVWERADGFWPGMMRAFDWTHRYVLGQGVELETTAVALAPDEAQVRLRLVVEVGGVRRRHLGRAIGGGVAGAALAVGWVMLLPAGHIPVELLGVAAGGGVSVASVAGSRRAYRRDLERVQSVLERFLDALEHERGG
jgi:hypothetical protein